jgi:hypothetical protein
MSSKNTYWTISIIAQYDPKVKEEYLELEESILSQNPNDSIRYLLFFFDQISETACIKKAERSPSGSFVIHIVENLGKIDFYSGYHLHYFFKQYVAESSCAKEGIHKHLLLTFAHGSGFGFFSKKLEEKVTSFLKDSLGISVNEEDTAQAVSYFEYLTFLQANLSLKAPELLLGNLLNQFLSLHTAKIEFTKAKIDAFKATFVNIRAEDFATILIKGLNKEDEKIIKVDILLCTTCYVQMIETGYALKDAVHTMIAPQTTIPFFGYNYKKLFNLLHNDPEASQEEIADNITTYYPIKYAEDPIKSLIKQLPRYKKLDVRNEVVIIANNLQGYCKIVKQLAVLLIHFNKNYQTIVGCSATLKDIIELSVSRCDWLTTEKGDSGVIDFLNFFEKLCHNHTANFIRETFRPIANQLPVILKETRLSIYNNGTRYNTVYVLNDNFPTKNPTFISIFLPVKLDSPIKVALLREFYKSGTQRNIGFYKDTGWDEFVYKILNVSP